MNDIPALSYWPFWLFIFKSALCSFVLLKESLKIIVKNHWLLWEQWRPCQSHGTPGWSDKENSLPLVACSAPTHENTPHLTSTCQSPASSSLHFVSHHVFSPSSHIVLCSYAGFGLLNAHDTHENGQSLKKKRTAVNINKNNGGLLDRKLHSVVTNSRAKFLKILNDPVCSLFFLSIHVF